MNYLYDETYDGFLTCVYHHWYTEKAEGIFSERSYQLDLCRYAMTVETDPEKAKRVWHAITDKISKWDAERIYRVFCTIEPEKEMKLIRYIALGFKQGPKIRLLHGDPIVKEVEAAEQRIGFEVHRLTGLVRFSEVLAQGEAEGKIQPLLYSKIEPDNDVLEFIAPHFADRFKSEPIIIHDLRRRKALFAFGKKWRVAPLSVDTMDSSGGAATCRPTAAEKDYGALWKQYFSVMGTRERENPRCQRQFMPARYWKHLTELN